MARMLFVISLLVLMLGAVMVVTSVVLSGINLRRVTVLKQELELFKITALGSLEQDLINALQTNISDISESVDPSLPRDAFGICPDEFLCQEARDCPVLQVSNLVEVSIPEKVFMDWTLDCTVGRCGYYLAFKVDNDTTLNVSTWGMSSAKSDYFNGSVANTTYEYPWGIYTYVNYYYWNDPRSIICRDFVAIESRKYLNARMVTTVKVQEKDNYWSVTCQYSYNCVSEFTPEGQTVESPMYHASRPLP